MTHTATRPIAVSDADFDSRVLKSDTPVLVDFWAEWCGPCRALGPVIEALSGDYDGRVKIAKVDVDRNQRVAMQYGIRSIPTVLLFDKGRVVDSFIGVRPKAAYSASLDRALGTGA